MYIDKYGHKRWINSKGQLHRENGPAIEWLDGTKQWYKNAELHRDDGPACENSNGSKVWYVKDIRVLKEEFNSWIKRIKKCL